MPVDATTSRRRLLQGTAGALLGVAVRPGAAPAAPLTVAERPDVAHRGRALAVGPGGRMLVVSHAAERALQVTDRRTRRTRTIALAGQALELALDPAGARVAATTPAWDHPGVAVAGLRGGGAQHVDAGPSPFAVAFAHDGRHLLVTGGEQDGALRILAGPGFAAGRAVALGRVPRGLAAEPRAQAAWVALHAESAIVRIDLRGARVTRRIATPPFPDRLALSPDGRTLLITHGGHDAHALSELDLHTGRLRRRPLGGRAGAVAWGPDGRRLALLPERDRLVSIDRAGHRSRHSTVTAPRGLAVAGRHVFTVSSIDGAMGRVRV